MTLTEFLLARIAEDEAEASTKHDIAYDDGRTGHCGCGYSARVLAECEAKRQIVERCRQVPEQIAPHYVLRELSAIYSDHPDYLDEWRP